jgi:hypothetical protein
MLDFWAFLGIPTEEDRLELLLTFAAQPGTIVPFRDGISFGW